jgi:hypothetical protein
MSAKSVAEIGTACETEGIIGTKSIPITQLTTALQTDLQRHDSIDVSRCGGLDLAHP